MAAEQNLSFQQAMALYECLFKEPVALGAVNSENILDGLDADIRLARALNAVQ